MPRAVCKVDLGIERVTPDTACAEQVTLSGGEVLAQCHG